MEGTSLYAKAYVPTYATEVREYLRTAVALGQRIGTSVDMYWGESGTVQDGNLASLDLVHPDRAALAGSFCRAGIEQGFSYRRGSGKHA